MKTTTQQQKILYGILALVVSVLVILIGWFVYLLVKPSTSSTTTNENVVVTNVPKNTNQAVVNANTTTVNNNANTNSITNLNDASNTNSNNSSNSNISNTNEDGLVEPVTNNNTNSNTNVSATEPTYSSSNTSATTTTLYFAKSGGSCGEVGAVQRSFTPGDDPYGQIILDDMRGPTADETGYTDGIPSTIKLKQVQYTSAGSVITVNAAYNDLSDCEKKTVAAQLIKTANTMFDVSADAAGEVIVGEATLETDTNSNTNQ